MMRSIRFALALAFVTNSAVAQVTRLVPEQYPTVQSAIDACGTGDTVSVAPGAYSECITFAGKDIRVRSRTGPSTTILQAPDGLGSVVRIPAGSTNAAALIGFTVRYGGPVIEGGGINTSYSSPVIANCIVRENYGEWGGGIGMQGGAPTIIGCLIVVNTGYNASGIGAGWAVTGGSIIGCTIVANHTSYPYGYAVVINNNPMTISNSILRVNTANNIGVSAPFSGQLPQYSNYDLFAASGTNINVDPLFASPSQGDYRLTSNSPSIGAASLSLLPSDTADLDGDGNTTEPIPLDLDGHLRLCAGALDQGAFEFPINAVIYCTAKANSLGCLPAIAATGLASAGANSGFLVSASNVRNNKAGLLLYGFSGGASMPFSGGLMCVAAPQRRSSALASGGAPAPVDDCSGVYQIDMNAFAHGLLGGTPAHGLLSAGARVAAQFWGRDPGFPAPDNATLSDALEYDVQP